MIERLPTPWGLVRLGVAPDHPKIKEVSRAFEKIAARPGFRFLGNVELGRDLTPDDLARLYDAVVYAVGAQTDRHLGIPGEDLPGSWPATVFVAWYNGHPDFQDLEFDLSGERAVVIGNGNVAVDVARMLALTAEELAPTDTTDPAIAAIAGSGIREILMLGRRGPVQGAFTTPELIELGELAGADVVVDPAELELDPGQRRRARGGDGDPEAEPRRPARVRRPRTDRQAEIAPAALSRLARRDPRRRAGRGDRDRPERARPRRTRQRSRRSDRGARGDPVQCRLPQRRLPRRRASRRALRRRPGDDPKRPRTGRSTSGGSPVPGVYCAGWIKRGPSGVIGTNKKDATETIELLLEDARSGATAARAGGERRGGRCAARRARCKRRHVYGLGVDRQARDGAGRCRSAVRASSSRPGTSFSTPRAVSLPRESPDERHGCRAPDPRAGFRSSGPARLGRLGQALLDQPRRLARGPRVPCRGGDELVALDREQPAVGHSAHGRHARRAVEQRDLADDAARGARGRSPGRSARRRARRSRAGRRDLTGISLAQEDGARGRARAAPAWTPAGRARPAAASRRAGWP